MKIGFVTRYSPPGVKHEFGKRALAWYTANLLSGLPAAELHYEIYADKLTGQPLSYYENERVEVIRSWTPNAFSVFQIIRQIAKSRPDLVHVQHEVFHFGPAPSAILILLLFLYTKIVKIPTLVTLHQVFLISRIEQPFLKQYGLPIPAFLVRWVLWLAIAPIVILADGIIVHARKFTQILASEYRLSRQIHKVIVIPLGVEDLDTKTSSVEAKARLGFPGKRILLFLGNLTGYKGLELLVDSMGILEKKHDDLVLIIGGRDTPGFKVIKEGGLSYSDWLTQRAQAVSSHICFVGFIEHGELPLYFAAADLVVLPYTLGFSSSGPLALALSYRRPFIVSTSLEDIVELEEARFEPTVSSLAEKIDRFLKSEDLRGKIIDYGLKLREERLWPHIGKKTYQLYCRHLKDQREQQTR